MVTEIIAMKNVSRATIRIGCAGWTVPNALSARFAGTGTHLARYAGEFNAVEINSSFYKPHRPATYAKWSESVPADFRFAVKIPKEVTHVRRLVDTDEILEQFLLEATALGVKLGPFLVQLPPSLEFCGAVAEKFFTTLRNRYDGDIVLEPRHSSWFERSPNDLLVSFRVARVAADPARVAAAAVPGGWGGLIYYRLHGSPRMYYSDYPTPFLNSLATDLINALTRPTDVWCIFDNTAAGAAQKNAIDLVDRIHQCLHLADQETVRSL